MAWNRNSFWVCYFREEKPQNRMNFLSLLLLYKNSHQLEICFCSPDNFWSVIVLFYKFIVWQVLHFLSFVSNKLSSLIFFYKLNYEKDFNQSNFLLIEPCFKLFYFYYNIKMYNKEIMSLKQITWNSFISKDRCDLINKKIAQ